MTDNDASRHPPEFDERLAPIAHAWAPHLIRLALAAVHLASVDGVRAPANSVLRIPGLLHPLDRIAEGIDQAAAAYEIQLDEGDDSAFAMHYDATDELARHLMQDVVSALRLPPDHVVFDCYVTGYVGTDRSQITTRLDMRLMNMPFGRRSDHTWPSRCTPIWSDIALRPTVDDAVRSAIDILPGTPIRTAETPIPPDEKDRHP